MLTEEQKKELLSEHFLLRRMSDDDLEKLVDHSITKTYGSEEKIFNRGDPAAEMMVVVDGKVQISSPRPEDDKIIFATMHPGDAFGEIALIDGYQRSADAVALEATELLVLKRGDFLGILEDNPHLCIDLLKILCQRIRRTNELLEDFSILDLRRRLAKRLTYLSRASSQNDGSGLKINVRISTTELIAMMGVSRDLVISHLQLWDSEDFVKLTGEWVEVLKQDELTKILREDA